MKELTGIQKKVFDLIISIKKEIGAPPTIREISDKMGFKSINNVRQHLKLIEKKGYIRIIKGRSRGIEIVSYNEESNSYQENSGNLFKNNTLTKKQIPLIGTISAGVPITAEENKVADITIDSEIFRGDNLFSLRVKGDSMIEAGILNGDMVIIKPQSTARNGEIVAVIIDDEATLKRYYRKENHTLLHPENSNYEDIIIPKEQSLLIAGKLYGVIRKYF
jgi:repressor LexA